MKKITLSITLLTVISLASFAQVSDTTSVEKPKVENIKKDSVEVVVEPTATSVIAPDSIPGLPPVVAPIDTEPRIIYYQDSKPEYRDKRNDIKTLSGSMSHSGGFIGVSFRASEFKDETAVMAGFRTGWVVNRTLGIGIEGHGIIPTVKLDNVDPNRDVILLGGYGGMFMEFVAFSNQVVHITFPIAGGAGWLGYHEDWEDESLNDPRVSTQEALSDQDVFWYVEPGASLEMNISRSFRMSFGLSKRITQDLDLLNTNSSDFENLNFFVTLKLGKF